jgi:plasmid stabilization system protein ParE
MANIVFHPDAEAEYRDGYAWYEARSAKAAANFEAAIEHALALIRNDPNQWPICDDQHHLYILRRYPYSIVYSVQDQTITVVAIAHARRRPNYWKDRV